MDARLAEVRRLLDRYIVEIVETYDFCPWAKAARTNGELAVDVLWGNPSLETWMATSQRLLARRQTRVVMVVAPELAGAPSELRRIRNRVAAGITTAGVAEFHPDAALDLATAARLVPYLRRAPDPLLQLVPFELLDGVRAHPAVVDLTEQTKMLTGAAIPTRRDVGDTLAEANHQRVRVDAAAITATLDDIAADRKRSYARVGIAINTSR